jgi:hypothetical protein
MANMTALMMDYASLVSVPLSRTTYHKDYDFDNAEVLHIGRCSIQPFLSTEDEVDRDTRISQCRLISDDPGFFQATAQNYIEFDGNMWKIDGKPFLWKIGGRIHHIELTMRLVEG